MSRSDPDDFTVKRSSCCGDGLANVTSHMELSIWRWLEMVQTIWMEKCGKKRGPCFPLVFTNMGGKLLRADGWIGRQARRQASQEAG
jgi:hypothetical protein